MKNTPTQIYKFEEGEFDLLKKK